MLVYLIIYVITG